MKTPLYLRNIFAGEFIDRKLIYHSRHPSGIGAGSPHVEHHVVLRLALPQAVKLVDFADDFAVFMATYVSRQQQMKRSGRFKVGIKLLE